MGSLSTTVAGFGAYPVRFQNDVAVGFTVVYLDRTRAMNPSVSRIVVFKQGGKIVEVKPESSEHRDFVRELQSWDEELVRMRPIPPVFFSLYPLYQRPHKAGVQCNSLRATHHH